MAFGVAALGFNLFNEYTAYGGETRFSDLPSFGSFLNRTGLVDFDEADDPNADLLEWRGFLSRQLSRIGGAAIPYALSPWESRVPEARDLSPPRVAFGALALVGTLAALIFARRDRALWAALALFGLLWAVVMRRHVFWPPHYFESVFYAGVPLALYSLALIRARDAWGTRPVKALALAALAAFAASAILIGGFDRDAAAERTRRALMADFENIREKADGKTAFIEPSLRGMRGNEYGQEMVYYTAGSPIVNGDRMTFAQMRRTDFVIGEYREEAGFVPLTPRNRLAFLYAVSPADLHSAERRRALASKRVVNSVFEARLDGDALYFLKQPCGESDVQGRFLLSVHSADIGDLPAERRDAGHESLNFSFSPMTGTFYEGGCIMRIDLPNYEIARIETGQWTSAGGLWSAAIDPSADAADLEAQWDAAERERQTIADGEPPIIRSVFDVYADGGALVYIKEGCAGTDTLARFMLSVFPANREDLPERFRELGHESLNFDFHPHGTTFGGDCVARRELPDYEISRIETGQWTPGGGRLWTAEADIFQGGAEKLE